MCQNDSSPVSLLLVRFFNSVGCLGFSFGILLATGFKQRSLSAGCNFRRLRMGGRGAHNGGGLLKCIKLLLCITALFICMRFLRKRAEKNCSIVTFIFLHGLVGFPVCVNRDGPTPQQGDELRYSNGTRRCRASDLLHKPRGSAKGKKVKTITTEHTKARPR
jgi:hypothetical protein